MNTEDKLSQILQDLAVVKNQLNDLTKLKDDVDELKEKVIALEIKNVDQQKEIDELKEEKKYYTRWAITAIGGAIVSALLAVLQFII
ncbi:MAG: threonine/serine exporter family protein [Methanobrevibacter sp.]|nr:threonine/serine exporter family protein [Methanobrevibacter sp.]